MATRNVVEKTLPIHLIDSTENLGRLEEVPRAPKRLVESIRENGLLQPIVVEPVDGGRFRLIAGQSRLMALRELGEQYVRASIRTFDSEVAARAAALAENTVRDDFSLYEETMLVHRLCTKYKADPSDLARLLGHTGGRIRAMIRVPDILTKAQLEAFRKCKSRQIAHMFIRAAEVRSKTERDKLLHKPDTLAVPRVRGPKTVMSFRDDLESDVEVTFRGRKLTQRERAVLNAAMQWLLRATDNPFTVRSQPQETEEPDHE